MESFDSLLTCCICLDRFRNPKLLPCQHTFCMEPCMEGLIDYVKRQVKCPECRAEHRIPYKGIQEFPSNVTMQRFLEMYQAISGELPDPNQGQVMERCTICNEKEYLQSCAHCDKKVCPECKSAHVDVLKREVVRINNQVRRGLHKLQEALQQVERSAGTVQQNCAAVHTEVDSLGQRLIKAIHSRTEVLKAQVDAHMAAEVRSLATLKSNLEQEIANIESNSQLAERYMNDQIEWDDCELMDAKDIFLKTVEFIRNFEHDASGSGSGDSRRPVRFSAAQDANSLHRTLEHLGDLNITKLQENGGGSTGTPSMIGSFVHSSSSVGPGLMRSKSDHRLVSQMRQQEERGYGDDSGRSSPVARRRFGDRATGRRGSEIGLLGDDSGAYDSPCERRSRYRSRFTRRNLDLDDDLDSYRPEPSTAARQEASREKKKERQKVLDTDDASRGPLSGITRIADVPRVMLKLADSERGPRKRSEPVSAPAKAAPTTAVTQPPPATVPWRRQKSEEDEISKIKKQNKEADARCSRGGAAAAAATSAETASPTRAASVSRTSVERRTSQPSTPTSTLQRPRLSREESGSETEDSVRRRPSRVSRPSVGASISEGTREPRNSPPTPPQRKISEPARTVPAVSRSSSGDSPSRDAAEERPRPAPLRNTWERHVSRSNSSESTSSESSTGASVPKSTGAAFSTNEIKSRFMRGVQRAPAEPSPPSRYTVGAGAAAAAGRPPTVGGISSVDSPSTAPSRPRFQSRFLGRAGTPKAEASKESTSSSGSSESESESSESDSDSDGAPASTFRGRASSNMAKTSIGPLLARSAQARSSAVTDTQAASTKPTATSSAVGRPTRTSMLGYGSRRESTDYTPAATSGSERYTPAATSGSERYTPAATSGSERYTPAANSGSERYTPAATSGSERYTPAATSGSERYTSAATSGSERYTPAATSGSERYAPAATSGSERYTPAATSGSERYTPTATSGSERYMSRYGADASEPKPYESRYSSSSRYSSDLPASNGLTRSRTSSHLESRSSTVDPDTYTSKYTRPSRSSAYDDYTPRYSSYSSRFLNPDEGSAAHAAPTEKAADSWSAAATAAGPAAAVAGVGRTDGTSRHASPGAGDGRPGRARSTSSDQTDEPGSGDARAGPVAPARPSVGQRQSAGEAAQPVAATGSRSEALASWAQYLKNKYGYANSDARHKAKGVTRTRSSHLLSLLPGETETACDPAAPPSPTAASVPLGCPVRSHYMQKGRLKFKIGSRGGGPGQLTWPRGIAVGPDNSIVVADSSNHRVQVFDPNGTFVKEFGQYGNGEAEFDCLAGVSVNMIGQFIISDRYNHRIQIFDPSGRFLRAFGQNGVMEGRFNYPWGVTTDALGFIYCCDKENHRVQVFQSDGTFVGTIGSEGRSSGQLAHPHYIAVSATNRVVVSDSNNHRVQVFDVNGRCLTTFGGEGSDDGKFKFPRGVAVDDQGYIVVGDSGNHRIQIFNPDGEFLRAFGCWGSQDGEFKGLEGVAVTSSGSILVCDRENHRIQVF